ncbi:hypothetical protein BT63DRAFT_103099 [Microthyrium microscopicum]|uniref:Uncharacterized protein n=1 Tax=Microthyrium microscopicum TaxID=703497 RepID=A0A6A6TVS5_9PEZI|nr:hypothetical protein BT63DRAFT_103099 [Microthyrium microscopicum]
MSFNQLDPKPIQDDDSTIYTAMTPPETIAVDHLDDLDPLGPIKISPSSVPWPGSSFIIRSASSGNVITLLDGQIVLDRPGSRGSFHWACVETKGWIGFRNAVSGRFLGHDPSGKLHCSAQRQQGWENFCVRLRPDGGYLLLMTHFERLWHVGIKMERGIERLAKIGHGEDDGMVFEFIKV